MKGDRTLDKVAVVRLENPGLSIREVAEIAEVGRSSVSRADQKLGQIGSKYPEIEEFIKGSLRVMQLGQNELDERLSDPIEKKKIPTRDVNTITDSAQRRYSLFAGEVTNEKGGLIIQTINYGTSTDSIQL